MTNPSASERDLIIVLHSLLNACKVNCTQMQAAKPLLYLYQ
jgi:hypothetical protein